VKKLEGEIVIIEEQVKEEVGKLETEIKEMQAESKHKMEALSDLKAKLTKIENEYENICEEIVEKDELKGGVKIMKSGISRLYYHKKISEMEGRWRETEKETKKLRNNLQELREKTRISGTLNLRMETEIENILNMDKSKTEPENKLLRELMGKCKETFQTTLKTLEEVNEVKLQTQDYEMKVHSLSGKNYKQNI
jgi:chromosome segregation ATPase